MDLKPPQKRRTRAGRNRRSNTMNNGRSYEDSDYVSTSIAAQMLGFHRNTIVQRIKSGKIKAHRVEREYRIAKSEIQRIKEGRITD